MAGIAVLPKEISELIAAGEVVERPASVIKELVENSIDAGATVITVEIERGGVTYMRVTDNGCGIKNTEVKTAFLRHATSKIKSADDLDAILTLGFRGEALASISAVARVELLTKTKDSDFGVGYVIHGGEEVSFEEVGCPVGTTIIIRDLFYNVPARMKFLKKDVSEANTVAAVMERIALSNPSVAIKFIRDGKTVITTTGDGKLKSAVYSVLGRDYTSSLIEVNYNEGNLKAEGFTCIPSRCRPNRNGQFFFLNGRYIKSGTMAAALDQAYKNSAMVGKFPACVLNITVPAGTVDVNVHPTKTEVRFSDERSVFELVYRAVKQAIAYGDRRPELNISAKKPVNMFSAPEGYTQERLNVTDSQPKAKAQNNVAQPTVTKQGQTTPVKTYTAGFGVMDNNSALGLKSSRLPEFEGKASLDDAEKLNSMPYYTVLPETDVKASTNKLLDIEVEEKKENGAEKAVAAEQKINKTDATAKSVEDDINPDIDINEISYVGEAFATYIIVSHKDTLYFVDKHAAHERINFEKLKKELKIDCQLTLMPVTVTLMRDEYTAIITNGELLERFGFIAEDFGDNTVIVRGIPAILTGVDIPSLISEIAGNLNEKGTAESDRIDDILHSIACKSAIKAGNITSKDEQLSLAIRVISSKRLMYCPHGRPIAFTLKKSQIEKQFGRLG